MELDELPGFINFMFEKENDEQLLEAWRSNPFQEKSFKDWKEEVLQEAKEASKTPEQRKAEALEAERQILKDFGVGGGS